jgi:regulator of replication initiation timing
MNKDELIRENERLSSRVSQLLNDCSGLRKKLTDVEDEL